jgi:hypothetical protein
MLSVVAPYHATQNETVFFKTFFNEIYILANLQVLLDPLKPFYPYLTFQGKVAVHQGGNLRARIQMCPTQEHQTLLCKLQQRKVS